MSLYKNLTKLAKSVADNSLGAFEKLRKPATSFMPVRLSAWNNSAPTRRILMKFDISLSCQSLPRKLKVPLKSDKHKGYFTCRVLYIKTYAHLWSHYFFIYFQQDAALHSLFISGKLLYMFWVVSSPIIRSTYNCIYRIWYLLTVMDKNKLLVNYKLTCNTCKMSYIGQTSRNLKQRYREHTSIRYTSNNNPQSAYAQHILQKWHEYGSITDTMTLLKPIHKMSMLTPYE